MQGVAFQYNHGRSTLMWIAPLTLGETDIMHAAAEPPRFPLQLTGEISGPSPIRICRFSVSAGRQRAPAVGFPARPIRHSTKLFDQIGAGNPLWNVSDSRAPTTSRSSRMVCATPSIEVC